MHSLTLLELKRMKKQSALSIECIEEEKETTLPKNRTGAYDFLVKARDKKIGIEVMTRPTKGKLKEKLRYKNNVDRFIFVLPHKCLGLYKKKPKKGFSRKARPKFFPKKFNDKKIRVWLLEAKNEKFTQKKAFCNIFNVESD